MQFCNYIFTLTPSPFYSIRKCLHLMFTLIYTNNAGNPILQFYFKSMFYITLRSVSLSLYMTYTESSIPIIYSFCRDIKPIRLCWNIISCNMQSMHVLTKIATLPLFCGLGMSEDFFLRCENLMLPFSSKCDSTHKIQSHFLLFIVFFLSWEKYIQDLILVCLILLFSYNAWMFACSG